MVPVPEARGWESSGDKLVWERVEPHLAGCSTVIVIPDGDLCFLPWAALPGRAGGILGAGRLRPTPIATNELPVEANGPPGSWHQMGISSP